MKNIITMALLCLLGVAEAGVLPPAEGGYQLVYELDLNVGGDLQTNVPYHTDNSASIGVGSFERVAYHVQLQRPGQELQWVWVSMDAFTDDPTLTGVPSFAGSGATFQQTLTNMNVFSNVAGIVTGEGIQTGNIEFWPTNYGTSNSANIPGANPGAYDFGDDPHVNGDYGSMQIHNYGAGQTLFALNEFAPSSVSSYDLGIGNSPGQHRDWTFAYNSGQYEIKTIDVYVSAVPLPGALVLLAPALLGLGFVRRKTS